MHEPRLVPARRNAPIALTLVARPSAAAAEKTRNAM